MRYSEIFEKKSMHKGMITTASDGGKSTQLIRIPAGFGPVKVYIRDGKVFVISDQPLEQDILP